MPSRRENRTFNGPGDCPSFRAVHGSVERRRPTTAYLVRCRGREADPKRLCCPQTLHRRGWRYPLYSYQFSPSQLDRLGAGSSNGGVVRSPRLQIREAVSETNLALLASSFSVELISPLHTTLSINT